jgi:phage-related protein
MEQLNSKNYKSNMKQLAKLLNIEIGQIFKIQFFLHKQPYKYYYKLTEDGLIYNYNPEFESGYKSDALGYLLLGKHQIVSI